MRDGFLNGASGAVCSAARFADGKGGGGRRDGFSRGEEVRKDRWQGRNVEAQVFVHANHVGCDDEQESCNG